MTVIDSFPIQPSPPPLYGIIQGDLFRYGNSGLVAFESPSAQQQHQRQQQEEQEPQRGQDGSILSKRMYRKNKCILLGGLSDGLLPVPYTGLLQEACESCSIESSLSWSLVQPILSSSYTGFGHGSLDRDVEELDSLIQYLQEERTMPTNYNKDNDSSNTIDNDNTMTNTNKDISICLVGHSTGCQDIVHYLKYGKYIDKVVCVALQGPVSDREAARIFHPTSEQTRVEFEQKLEDYLNYAIKLRSNNDGDEFMPRSSFWAPITANRYYNLFAKGGMDDYFSSDYTDDELSDRLGHIGILSPNLRTCLVAWPGSDEYVPSYVNGQNHLHRLVTAMNSRILGRSGVQTNYDTDDKNKNNDVTTAPTTATSTMNNVVGDCKNGAGGTCVAKGLYIESGNHNLSMGPSDAKIFVQAVREMLISCTITSTSSSASTT